MLPDLGSTAQSPSIQVAVPGQKESTVEVYLLPEETLYDAIGPPSVGKCGMVMALDSFRHQQHDSMLIAGYESGHVCVFRLHSGDRPYEQVYTSQPHTQPVLSLAYRPSGPSLSVRSQRQTEIAASDPSQHAQSTSLLHNFYSSAADDVIAAHTVDLDERESHECNIHHTKHSGQQSLTVRDDASIFATAGWDSRVRIYTANDQCQELAVLKWHNEGCFAVAFAQLTASSIGNRELSLQDVGDGEPQNNQDQSFQSIQGSALSRVPRRARRRREEEAQSTHWVAVGSKDGKVSLWEIY